MFHFSVAQLRVVDAVVAVGSLQAAAARLNRTHPTLHTSLAKME
jgi:DNA-binding transcriptional LysR family regulator